MRAVSELLASLSVSEACGSVPGGSRPPRGPAPASPLLSVPWDVFLLPFFLLISFLVIVMHIYYRKVGKCRK